MHAKNADAKFLEHSHFLHEGSWRNCYTQKRRFTQILGLPCATVQISHFVVSSLKAELFRWIRRVHKALDLLRELSFVWNETARIPQMSKHAQLSFSTISHTSDILSANCNDEVAYPIQLNLNSTSTSSSTFMARRQKLINIHKTRQDNAHRGRRCKHRRVISIIIIRFLY